MQLHANDYWTLNHDEAAGTVDIVWTEASAEMGDKGFKEALERLAGQAEAHAAPRILVDVRRFRHPMTPELGQWRTEAITPRYNKAGVRRFAYVVGTDTPMAGAAEKPPEQHPGEDFLTGFFAAEQEAREWLAEA